MLDEGVDAVVNTRCLPLPFRRPVEVVDAQVHIVRQAPTIVEIPSTVLRSPTRRHIRIAGVIHRVADGDAIARRELITQLQPTALAADLSPCGSVHALPDTAAKVAQVAPKPRFTAQIPTRGEPPLPVHANAVAEEAIFPRHRGGGALPRVVSP